MSIIVLNALADSLSVGDMKFPAALFITTLGKPTYNIIEIKLGSVFSAASEFLSEIESYLLHFEEVTFSTHESIVDVTAVASLMSH